MDLTLYIAICIIHGEVPVGILSLVNLLYMYVCVCFCVCRSVEYLQNACCEGAANKDSDSDSDSASRETFYKETLI